MKERFQLAESLQGARCSRSVFSKSARCSQDKFDHTAPARKNKGTARMLTNALKDRSIPLVEIALVAAIEL